MNPNKGVAGGVPVLLVLADACELLDRDCGGSAGLREAIRTVEAMAVAATALLAEHDALHGDCTCGGDPTCTACRLRSSLATFNGAAQAATGGESGKTEIVRRAINRLRQLGEWDGKTFDPELTSIMGELRACDAATPAGGGDDLAERLSKLRQGLTDYTSGSRFKVYDADDLTTLDEAIRRLASAPAPARVGDDTSRLDWLEKHEAELRPHHESFGVDDPESQYSLWWNVVKNGKSISGHPLGYVRDAIDYAMAAAPAQEPSNQGSAG